LSSRAIRIDLRLIGEHEDVDPIGVVAGLDIEIAVCQRRGIAQRQTRMNRSPA
jgi:hypothetical protein